MAMMISKFHKLIQSKLLWIVFLVVIVFSFVVWGMVWPSDIEETERINAAGLLDGEPVTHGEFRSAYLSAYMARALALGRDIPATPEAEEALRRMAWLRLATLRKASALGIDATEQELVSAIRANFTGENQVYDRALYQGFLQNMIRPMGFTGAMFEQHVREEIIIRKLASLIGRQAHVTPLEIRRTYDTLLDSFTVDYVKLPTAQAEEDVNVTEADARALFDEDPAAFTLPEQREVRYAAYPLADFIDVEAEIPEDDILDYYELNIDDYTTTEEGEDGEPRTVVAEVDEVREEIVAALRRQAAAARADAEGTELAFRAMPDREGRIPDFAEEAEQAGHPAQSLPPFSRFDVPVEDGGAAFTAAAFQLEEGPFDRVSTPVIGEENAYVIFLDRIHPPRVPDFEEVREEALEQARRRAVFEAIQEQSNAIRTAAEEGLANGESFADAVASFGLDVVTTEPFTGLTGSSSEDEAIQALVQSVVAYNQGEVTEPLAVSDGALVAYVALREPADPAAFGAYRDEIESAIRSRRARSLFMDWQAELLGAERFTDLQRQALPEEEEVEEEIEAEEAAAESGSDDTAGDEPM